MEADVFEAVAVGDLVYVHDSMPPSYTLLVGQVEQKLHEPRVLKVYLPALNRSVFSEPDRLHGYPLEEGAEAGTPTCPYCRVPSVTGAPSPLPPEEKD